MTDINGQLILELMKQNWAQPDFSDDEYNKLMNHFRENQLNQFYCIIIQKILTKRQFTISNEEALTEMTARLADKVGKTKTPLNTDEEIITYIIELYNFLMIIDIKDFFNKRF